MGFFSNLMVNIRGAQRIYRSVKTDRTEPIHRILDGSVKTSGWLRIDFLHSANLADGWRIRDSFGRNRTAKPRAPLKNYKTF